MAKAGTHRFGSDSTELKLNVIAAYLKQFTTALRPHFAELIYVDLFAGSGAREILHKASPANLVEDATAEWIEERRGSARIALENEPPFSRLFFIEKKKRFCTALEVLAAAYPSRTTSVLRGDANDKVLEVITRPSWANARAVMFIDPYGMQLSWKTLEAIRKTEAIDIWYLVSLQGLYRQAQTDRLGITPKKRAALTRMLGSDTWEAEWYTPKPLGGLFAFMSDVPIMGNTRCASVDDIEDYVGRRLKGLFPLVQGPLRLKTKNDKPGFALFFACSNPKREAFGLASRIAGYILKAGSSSQ